MLPAIDSDLPCGGGRSVPTADSEFSHEQELACWANWHKGLIGYRARVLNR